MVAASNQTWYKYINFIRIKCINRQCANVHSSWNYSIQNILSKNVYTNVSSIFSKLFTEIRLVHHFECFFFNEEFFPGLKKMFASFHRLKLISLCTRTPSVRYVHRYNNDDDGLIVMVMVTMHHPEQTCAMWGCEVFSNFVKYWTELA